jgi:predicted DNA binding CopG/RHH family protein
VNTKAKSGAEYRPFNLQLPVEMFDAAQQKAAEQGISMQRFIRMGVAGITGIPDRSRQWTPPPE